MTHEPECPCTRDDCTRPPIHCDNCRCLDLRLAYTRGRRDAFRSAMKHHNMQMADAIKWASESAHRMGVLDARKAVEGMLLSDPDDRWDVIVRVCLEAIDSLRGDDA